LTSSRKKKSTVMNGKLSRFRIGRNWQHLERAHYGGAVTMAMPGWSAAIGTKFSPPNGHLFGPGNPPWFRPSGWRKFYRVGKR